MEVKRCKGDAAALDARLEKEIQAYEAMFALWNEFDASLIKEMCIRDRYQMDFCKFGVNLIGREKITQLIL